MKEMRYLKGKQVWKKERERGDKKKKGGYKDRKKKSKRVKRIKNRGRKGRCL